MTKKIDEISKKENPDKKENFELLSNLLKNNESKGTPNKYSNYDDSSYHTNESKGTPKKLFDFTELNKLLQRKRFTKKDLLVSLTSNLESQNSSLHPEVSSAMFSLISALDPSSPGVRSITLSKAREYLQYAQDSQELPLRTSLNCYRIIKMSLSCSDPDISSTLLFKIKDVLENKS